MTDAQGNSYAPYDIEVLGSESEALTEDAWFDMFGGISGVVSGGALTFAGLTATLAPIDMRVRGSYLIRADPWSDASPATTTSAPRRDLLVARRQRTSGQGTGAIPGKTFLTVLRGTPAATPTDPAFDLVNDEPLWSWQVPGNGGTVATGQRDLRRSAANDLGPRGALCKPVKLSNGAGGAMKYAAPTGLGYYEVGRTPELWVPAGRMVRLDAPVSWGNGAAVAAVSVRWERVVVAGGGSNLQTADQSFYIGGSNLPDSVASVHHQFTDQITVAGVYSWRLAARTNLAGETAGIPADTWAFLNVNDMGPIPSV